MTVMTLLLPLISLGRIKGSGSKLFQNGHTDLSKLLRAADVPVKVQDGLEQQTISLFRSFLKSSGGKVDCRQHKLRIDYTTSQNGSLCSSFLDVSCSRQFGRFDSEAM